MSALRTSVAILLLLSAQPVGALPLSATERAQTFARCTGLYSALTEHLRLFDGPASERMQNRRDLFADVLDAVLPAALADGLPSTQAMAWRIEAKSVQAALLSTSVFDTRPARAEPARRRAAQNRAQCDHLLLGT